MSLEQTIAANTAALERLLTALQSLPMVANDAPADEVAKAASEPSPEPESFTATQLRELFVKLGAIKGKDAQRQMLAEFQIEKLSQLPESEVDSFGRVLSLMLSEASD